MKLLKSLTWMVMIMLAIGFVGCSDDDDDDDPVGPTTTDTFEEIFAAGDAYFSAGTKNITAEVVYTNQWIDQTTTYFIIDWRSTDHYNTAHIEGALDWTITELMDHHNAGDIPTDQTIVNVCYSGQTASQATAVMRMLGYDAYNLKFGMCGWTTADDVPMGGWPTLAEGGQTLETTANTLNGTDGLPERTEDLETYLEEYLSGGTKNMSSTDLYALLNDGDDLNDPVILNYWSTTMYDDGHIPGAVQMEPKGITMEFLESIPAGKEVVIYCHTGQTSSQLTPWFRAMGYEAYSMLYGMNSIDQSFTGLVTFHAPDQDYPVVYGN